MSSKKEQFYIQRISELEAQLKRRDGRIAALEKQVAELLKVSNIFAQCQPGQKRIQIRSGIVQQF